MGDRVEVYEDDDGEFRWRRWGGSDIVSGSEDGYKNKGWAEHQAVAKNEGDGISFDFDTTPYRTEDGNL